MATISFTISDPDLARVVDALAGKFGYDPEIHSGNKAVFVKSEVAATLRRWVVQQERQETTIADPDIT